MANDIGPVFADSHLQGHTWKLRPIHGDAYFSFEQIVTAAIESGSRWIIGAGDLINRRVNEPEPIIFLRRQLKRMQDHGICFAYNQGQHEMDEDSPWMHLGEDNAVHLHKHPVEIGGLNVYGLDFQPKGKLQEELAAVPENTDVLVCHQVWSDFMGEQTLPQGEIADVVHGNLLITGDLHQSLYKAKTYRRKDGQLLRVFSPGATHQLKINEPSDCYFGMLSDDGKIHRYPLRTRLFTQFSVTTPEQLEAFLADVSTRLSEAQRYAETQQLPAALHTPLWRVIYSHRLSDLPARIAKIVEGRAHLFWKELPAEPEDIEEKDQVVREFVQKRDPGDLITLESTLPQAVSQEEEPEVFMICQRLLDAADPAVELAKWKKEILDE